MAGIYIHIPFCRKNCSYCDFYFCLSLSQKDNFLIALKNEISNQQNFFSESDTISTVYFGGGTPSILSADEIKEIIFQLSQTFNFNKLEEITLECNADDITENYIEEISQTNINRLSIGIQSFNDNYLRLMNRRHDAKGALEALTQIKKSRFSNFSIDLIFGIPGQTKKELQDDLYKIQEIDPPHVSIYQLTYEPGTPLEYKLRKGRVEVQSQSDSEEQYNLIIEFLKNMGYEHYEVSNFAKPGMYSKHNSMYWNGEKYLGLGAGAHTYDGISKRRWNYSSIKKYIRAENYFEEEKLDDVKKYNEIILTRLRTMWGIQKNELKKKYLSFFLNKTKEIIDKDLMVQKNNTFKLTEKGMLVADKIMEDLFFEE